MNGLPYYPRYPRDFLEGTAGMSFEDKAAYGLILDLIYMMGERGLPDDARFICGHLGLTMRKWNSIRERLVGMGKIHVENGVISNKRADNEKIIQRKLRDKQRENRHRPNKNNNLQSPRSHHTDTDKRIGGGGDAYTRERAHAREGAPPPPPPEPDAAEALTLRERILEAIGLPDVVSGLTGHGSTRLGTAEDMIEVRAWQSDLGLSPDEIVGVVSEIMALKRDGPPRNLRYFRRTMQSLVARKAEALASEPAPAAKGHQAAGRQSSATAAGD